MALTEEQRQQIERNRLAALERLEKAKERRRLEALQQEQQQQQQQQQPQQNDPRPVFPLFNAPLGNSVVHQSSSDCIPAKVSVQTQPLLQQPNRFRPLYPLHPSGNAQIRSVTLPASTSQASTSVPATSGAREPGKPLPPLHKIEAQAVLTSRSRFTVKTTAYCQPLINFCKSFRTASYNCTTRNWSFDMSDYTTFDRTVRAQLKDYITFESLPRCVLDVHAKGAFKLNEAALEAVQLDERIPPFLLNSLLPYQRTGVKFAVQNNGNILLADDMGLGKTIQAIAAATYFREDWPVLCVCPSSMRYEWREQWHKWVKDLKDGDVSVITGGRQTDSLVGVQVAIITYDLLSTMKSHLLNRFRTVICDECHQLKNYKTVRTQAATAICRSARRILLLSGTPALSRPGELFSQIGLINRNLLGNFNQFGMRYCAGKQTHRGHMDYSGQSNAEELQILLESTVMLRRMKADVAQQLPDKTRLVVVLNRELVKFQDRSLTLSAEHYQDTAECKSASNQEIRKSLLQYYQQTGRAKVEAVVEYLKESFDDNDVKFVVFAHHTHVLNQIFHGLDGATRGMRIDGTTPAETRKQLCDRFQTDSSCRFACLSLTACSSGITLTAASVVLFAELYWNPGILAQAEDRLHRIGQVNDVTVRYLVAKDTADDVLWQMLQRKREFLNRVGLSRDNLTNVTVENQEPVSQTIALLAAAMDDDGEEGTGDYGISCPPTKRLKT